MTTFHNIIKTIMASATIMAISPCAASATGRTNNIAHYCAVRTSSCYDYNLTGQLLTDGIACSTMPPCLRVTTAQGDVPRREREWAIDGGEWSHNTLPGNDNFIQFSWTGMAINADNIGLQCTVAYNKQPSRGSYSIRILVKRGKADDGKWTAVAEEHGDGLPGTESRYKMSSDPNKQTRHDLLPARSIKLSATLPKGLRNVSAVRIEVKMDGAAYWNIGKLLFFRAGKPIQQEALPNNQFGSAWMSDGEGRQWAQVDLQGISRIDAVRLSWIRRPRRGHIEVSDDARQWKEVATLTSDNKRRDERIATPGTSGRYVRVVMDGGSVDVTGSGDEGAAKAYVLSELQVEGMGGWHDNVMYNNTYADGQMSLNLGDWHVCRASEVEASGEKLSTAKYKYNSAWIPARVPGTVLSSFVNYGAVDDPNIADNIFNVSDSYFNSDFWYRRTFSLPGEMRSRRVLLNFDGINWKADVWLNGKKIDRIEGAFTRSVADITPWLSDGSNTLAVLIHKNAHPGAVKEKNRYNTDYNGGSIGADNPTFHATAGWDWISTIRGRDIGIWNDVYLTSTDDVTLTDPLVSTRLANLPDTTATMTPRVVLSNRLNKQVSGTVRGWIGDIKFEKTVTLAGGEQREVVFEPEDFPTLRNRHMRLWWPNGYGEPYMYDAGFEFAPDEQKPDAQTTRITFHAGIRQIDYKDTATQLKIFVNGKRVIPLGGNWGFSEANLNYRERQYDTAVRLHRDMHFNMIRNWVGMTGDEEFYDACDRHGIMVWQDFWLANPADGPDPQDEHMFMQNARDFTSRMRQHPSIALYCGRNEGYPPKTLDTALRKTVADLNPGLLYISSSADEGVSGHGPYWAETPRTYFAKQTGKLHTERGMPNIMSPESMERTLNSPIEWQPADAWGQHDFTQEGAQRGKSFMDIVERMFGKVTSAEEFARLAQWENYDGYRAMYEADSKYRQGLLIWMSHPCWPSLTWQCYDYFFEPTAAFFGARKACEPIHIQWNPLTRNVEVVNRSAGYKPNLTAMLELMDMNGNNVSRLRKQLNSADDSSVALNAMHVDSIPKGIDGVYFLKLTLTGEDERQLSTNFYVLSTDEGNLQQLKTLPEVNLTTSAERHGDQSLRVTLRNASPTPAMMIRLNLKTDDGLQVLPVDYSDNYFHMMPGEQRTVDIGWSSSDTRNQMPLVELTGFNVKQRTLR